MSRERGEERLDAMLAPLRDHAAHLDEITQARVRARLELALARVGAGDTRAAGRGVRPWAKAAVGLAVAVAAVFAAVVVASGGAPGAREISTGKQSATGAGTAAAGTERPPVAEPDVAHAAQRSAGTAGTAGAAARAGAAASAVPGAHDAGSAAPSAPVTVAVGESVQLTLDGARVTVYGPGRLSPVPDGAIVEGAAIVVDRAQGDAPWSMHYHGVTIVVMHATFAVDHGAQTRVSVMRGEIELRCPSGVQTVRSGASATCEPAGRVLAASDPRPRGTSTEPPQQEPPVPDPPVPGPPVSGLLVLELRPFQRLPQLAAVDPFAAPESESESGSHRGDVDSMRDALLGIVDATPDSLDAASALLELARLAANRGDVRGALGYLDRLERNPRCAALADPAARLRDTVVRAVARSDAILTLRKLPAAP